MWRNSSVKLWNRAKRSEKKLFERKWKLFSVLLNLICSVMKSIEKQQQHPNSKQVISRRVNSAGNKREKYSENGVADAVPLI